MVTLGNQPNLMLGTLLQPLAVESSPNGEAVTDGPTFGDTIRDLRLGAKLTQRALAAIIGIDFTYLSKLENDHGDPPSEDTIRKLAAAVHSDPEVLLAAAGKLPTALKERAGQDQQFAMLLRKLPSLPKKDLDALYRRAGVSRPQK
jgi:HTH-type transcriptional regulator, competence development regulator